MATGTTGLSAISERYAAALFDLADEQKQLDPVADDLRGLKDLFAGSADLRRFVGSPLIARDQQAAAMAAVMQRAGVADLTRRFVGVVAGHRRLFALPAMIDAYLELLARRRGEVTAKVSSAQALSDTQTEALEASLKAAIGQAVAVDYDVDPDLIGGLVVRVGSRMVDSSLRTKLSKLQLAMKGVA